MYIGKTQPSPGQNVSCWAQAQQMWLLGNEPKRTRSRVHVQGEQVQQTTTLPRREGWSGTTGTSERRALTSVHLALLQVSHSVVQSARRFRAYVYASGQATSTFSV